MKNNATGGDSTPRSTPRSTRKSARRWTVGEMIMIREHLKRNDERKYVSTTVFLEEIQKLAFPNRSVPALAAKLWREKKLLGKNE